MHMCNYKVLRLSKPALIHFNSVITGIALNVLCSIM